MEQNSELRILFHYHWQPLGLLAVDFIMGVIVLFPIPVFRGLDLAVVLFNDRHAIRLGEPN